MYVKNWSTDLKFKRQIKISADYGEVDKQNLIFIWKLKGSSKNKSNTKNNKQGGYNLSIRYHDVLQSIFIKTV